MLPTGLGASFNRTLWHMKGAATNSSLSVASAEKSRPRTRVACASAAAACMRRGPQQSTLGRAASTTVIVRLYRANGLQSFWTSKVEGARHTRHWGLTRDECGYSMTLDFKEGGELAARCSHALAVASKLTPARMKGPRLYTRLGPDEQLPAAQPRAPVGSKRTRGETEEATEEEEFRTRCELFFDAVPQTGGSR